MNDADREILDNFVRTRNKTIELAKRVPEQWLARTPDAEDHALSYLLSHAGTSGAWWMEDVMRDGGPAGHPSPDTTAEIAEVMETYRDRVVSFFAADDGAAMGRTFPFTDEDGRINEWTGRNRVLYFTLHETHHRGKIVLALRQWGMTDIPFLPF